MMMVRTMVVASAALLMSACAAGVKESVPQARPEAVVAARQAEAAPAVEQPRAAQDEGQVNFYIEAPDGWVGFRNAPMWPGVTPSPVLLVNAKAKAMIAIDIFPSGDKTLDDMAEHLRALFNDPKKEMKASRMSKTDTPDASTQCFTFSVGKDRKHRGMFVFARWAARKDATFVFFGRWSDVQDKAMQADMAAIVSSLKIK